jgi:DnaJ-class molecular chaperone
VADTSDSEPGAEAAGDPTCLPCRGTGRVTSFLGGETNSVPCPWCNGTGTRVPGIDAQARWVDTD